MNARVSPRFLIAVLAFWFLACITAYVSRSTLIFEFAYFILPFSALLIPLIVGALVIRIFRSYRPERHSPPQRKLLTVATYVLRGMSYIFSFAILARLLEIPWRRAKFGEPLDLGGSTAILIFVASASIMGASYLLFQKLHPDSREAPIVVAGIGMVAFAMLLYVALGISPLVHWRA